MLKPTRFMRKPFFVTGYPVTLENMEDIARWCEGHIVPTSDQGPFIRVPVDRPQANYQTQAFVGHWVLAQRMKSGRKSFKVYDEIGIEKSFFMLDDFDDEDLVMRPNQNSPIKQS